MNMKIPDDMMKAVESVGLDDETKQLVTNILYAERVRKEQEWKGDAVDMLDKYLVAEQEKKNGFNL